MSESLNPLPFPVQIDPDALGRVVVLMGGHSSERNVSLDSGRNVLKALQAKGVDAEAFDPAERSLGDLEKAGYDRAFMTIADANVTVLIGTLILFFLGAGALKGFAITLAIGIVTSQFTAIVGSRTLAHWVFGKRQNMKDLPIW